MTNEEKYMNLALKQAKIAKNNNEVPVGAVIVLDGKVIAKAFNKRESLNDATAHAEILCIKKACKKLKDFRLVNADMYVTLEPCVMCLGAILNARINNVFVGALNNKPNAIPLSELVERAELNHKCTIKPLLMSECSSLLSEYFLDKRKG